jgi:nitric oxide reductase activation protein
MLEVHRVISQLAEQLPLAADLGLDTVPLTATPDESLRVARGKTRIASPPVWFGAIKPSRLLAAPTDSHAAAEKRGQSLSVDATAEPDTDDDDEERKEKSSILRLFENPLVSSRVVSDLLRKFLGTSRSRGHDAAGDELQVGAVRRALAVSSDAWPTPTAIQFTDNGRPAATLGIVGTLHPEWDEFAGRYRPDWCRVISSPLTAATDVSAAGVARDVSAAGVARDDILRRRLARMGLGLRALRARPDGDELDIEALIGMVADTRSGHSPPEHVYVERRKIARDLGVLILLDASGSVTDADPDGHAVHEHQRRAAATLTATLEELGDRVALYAFRSHGRDNVRLLGLKTFNQRFGAAPRARLNRIEPSGYTRLGAAIRGAGELLEAQAGTANRLLLVLSDGLPYDHAYEGRYAEADTRRALGELRSRGVACLCLSLSSGTEPAAVKRAFGSVPHVSAATLDELSPRMGELFRSALDELAVPL